MSLGTVGKVGISWAIVTCIGVYSFYLSRESVIARRTEHMRIRERMYASNKGEYESSYRKYAN